MAQLLSPTIADVPTQDALSVRSNSWTRWPKWLLLFLALFWLADLGVSFGIQHTRLRNTLTDRLEVAFGRPVTVGSFRFSVWSGPTLEAQSVTVAEDPRFGHEYFLHTESLTVRLLWSSLLRGRIGLGTLFLAQPSLNLVRSAHGDWNISEWLPIPDGSPAPIAPTGIGPRLAVRTPSFRRIEIDGGRINFKRGDEKLPYAFANVSGAVQAEDSGRWALDLHAAPWRAATVLQQVGMLHLTGDVGGTSSRLLPAALQLSWTDASLPDVLRLARSDDSGLRGTLATTVVASTSGENWNFQVRSELRQLHRWDLTLRPDNPAVNVIAKLQWNPQAQELDLTTATIEGPHSVARAAGKISWGAPKTSPKRSGASGDHAQVQIISSAIDLQDALSWLRAFRSGISGDVNIRGSAAAQMSLSGWPPRIEDGQFNTEGAELSEAGLRVPVLLGPAAIQVTNNSFSLSSPTTLSFGDESSTLRIFEAGAPAATVARKSPISPPHFHVTGKIAQVRDLVVSAGLFGWNLSRGWDVGGPALCDLQWEGPYPWQSHPAGFVEWGSTGDAKSGASLRAPFLNQPIGQIAARADLKPGMTHIALASAQAFGARWNGTLDRRVPAGDWRFALAADRLDASNLNAWLNPLAHENFLDRMLPFLNGRSQTVAVPDTLHAGGRLTVDRFTLAPMVVSGLQGDLSIDGRHLTFANASGQFFGGTVAGSLDADLKAVPSYQLDIKFSRADFSTLLADSPSLSPLTAVSAFGSATFETAGATRGDLLAALACDGKINVNDLALHSIDLFGSLQLGQTKPGTSQFQEASATFNCANGQVGIRALELAGSNLRLGGSGIVGFNRNFDLRLHVLSDDDNFGPRLAEPAGEAGRFFRLSGTLTSPQIAPAQTASPRSVR